MGLHYLTFAERNLEKKKKLTVVRIRNEPGTRTMNIANLAGIFSASVVMNNIFDA